MSYKNYQLVMTGHQSVLGWGGRYRFFYQPGLWGKGGQVSWESLWTSVVVSHLAER